MAVKIAVDSSLALYDWFRNEWDAMLAQRWFGAVERDEITNLTLQTTFQQIFQKSQLWKLILLLLFLFSTAKIII